jgi:SAM-dependent methyltransferase
MGRGISEEEVAAYWDRNAPHWADQVRKGYDAFRDRLNTPAMLERIGPVSGLRVLDAGCGEGTNARILARAGAKVKGVDISSSMIAAARAEERSSPLGIDYVLGSFSAPGPFEAGSFDLVVSFMALMDAPHYVEALGEFHRLLSPGGRLVFSVTHPCFLTPQLEWLQADAAGRRRLAVGSYFSEEHYVDEWCFSRRPEDDDAQPFRVPNFPRTLSGYLNPIVEAGFAIEGIGEPRPSEELCVEIPEWRKWREEAAIFLHVSARKPAR